MKYQSLFSNLFFFICLNILHCIEKIFHMEDVTITSEGFNVWVYTRRFWTSSRAASLSCHTCDTGPQLFFRELGLARVIEDLLKLGSVREESKRRGGFEKDRKREMEYEKGLILQTVASVWLAIDFQWFQNLKSCELYQLYREHWYSTPGRDGFAVRSFYTTNGQPDFLAIQSGLTAHSKLAQLEQVIVK